MGLVRVCPFPPSSLLPFLLSLSLPYPPIRSLFSFTLPSLSLPFPPFP